MKRCIVFRAALSCACGLLAAVPVRASGGRAAEFYVAPWGNDAGPGTFEQPFATLVRARDAVRPLVAAGLSQPVTVCIRGGTYRISEPLVLGVQDSGTEQWPVSYVAYPGEAPVISGGRVIDGWAAAEDGAWSVTLPEVAAAEWSFRELFVNGQRRPRARHPNSGFVRVESATPGVRTVFKFYEGDLPVETDLAGAELVFLHDWDISRVRIASVNHFNNRLFTAEPIGAAAPIFDPLYFEDHPRYYVEDDPFLLDAPGEWHLNETTGELRYRPLPGEDMDTAEVVAPWAGELLTVRGSFASAQFIQNVHFAGLAFEHCAWALPAGGYAGYQAGFYEDRDPSPVYALPSAITFEQAQWCSFENGRIAHVGGWGVRFGRSCRDCTLSGTAITDIAGNGIMIGEDDTRDVGIGPWWQLVPNQASQRNTVTNNLVEHCGVVFHGCVGVWVGLANFTEITHNLIRDLPYSGVSVGWKWDDETTPCHHNTIERNHIHDVMTMLSDGAGVYTLGLQAGTTVSGNRIHSILPNAGLSQSNGLFFDQGSTGLLIDGNAIFTVAKSPLRFHLAGLNTVSNNTLILSHPDVQPIRYVNMSPSNITLIGNDISVATGPIGCMDPVYAVAPEAGLQPPHLERLLGSIPADGCASCSGVPYSGVAADLCGVCAGDNTTCTIPAASSAALAALAVLLLLAAAVVHSRHAAH